MPLSFGKTFLMTGTGGVANPGGAHLMICLQSQDDKILLLPLVTRKPYSDASCVLQVGDHPFIDHESCIDYSYARICVKSALESKIDLGEYAEHEEVGLLTMKRILQGLLASEETPPFVLSFCQGIEGLIEKLG